MESTTSLLKINNSKTICFKIWVTIFFWICPLLETTYLILFDSKFPKLNRKDITKNLFFNNKNEMH
jgi:hypothetical protein